MLDAGMPIHKVRAWAGHKSIATTGIYANAGLGHLEGEMWRFEDRKIDERLTNEPDEAEPAEEEVA